MMREIKSTGIEIYEGDVILPKGDKIYYFVKWCDNGWKLRCGIPKNSGSYVNFNYMFDGKVIGDIHNNPKLLKGEKPNVTNS